MINGEVYYHSIIRKAIVGFGRLFSKIQIPRYDNEGNLVQTVVVPVAYAPKEKWIVRVDQDPELTNNTYTTLPRLSFEITGYSYDANRKLNRMNRITCQNADGSGRTSMFTPVPYMVDISLYALTKTSEDAFAIVEQILPIFSPEYTLSIVAVPEMNIVQDIPVVLNSVSLQDDYDGDFNQRRFVIHTFNFTLKLNVFGPITEQGLIKEVSANLNNPVNGTAYQTYNATQATPVSDINEEWRSLFG